MPQLADLDGPLEDFFERAVQIRTVISLVDSSAKSSAFLSPEGLVTARSLGLSARTPISSNSMAWVFLASSFEEYYREMIAQSAIEVFTLFSSLPDSFRINARSSYWEVCIQKLRFSRKITAKGAPVRIDNESLGRARSVIDSASRFVIGNESQGVDEKLFSFHSNNFKPHVLDEIGRRIGVTRMIRACSDTRHVRSLFIGSLNEIEAQFRAALDEFYDTRNEIVHSLSSVAGQGIDTLISKIDMFEKLSLAVQTVLKRHLQTLTQEAA